MNGAGRRGVRGLIARWRGRDIELKTPGEIDAIAAAGRVVAVAVPCRISFAWAAFRVPVCV